MLVISIVHIVMDLESQRVESLIPYLARKIIKSQVMRKQIPRANGFKKNNDYGKSLVRTKGGRFFISIQNDMQCHLRDIE